MCLKWQQFVLKLKEKCAKNQYCQNIAMVSTILLKYYHGINNIAEILPWYQQYF
jgi:hypothetical protein